jgi:hemolysin activation/secretion protein
MPTHYPLHHPRSSLALLLLLGWFAHSAQAQMASDAGSLRQQIEQARELALPPAERSPKAEAAAPQLQPSPGSQATVRAFRFAGNRLLSAEQLAPALASFLNRPLGFSDLQRAADAVAAVYRDVGWIVRVYLPRQDITEGLVTLQVVESRFGGVRFEGTPPERVQTAEIDAYFLASQETDTPLNAHALDRALLLTDDLPGVSVAGTLVPGPADGQTSLLLQTTDEPSIFGSVGIDNTGTRATGSQRVTANLNVNSPGRRGELIAVDLIHTRGSDYGRASLTVPHRHNGLRLGVSASSMNYRLIEGADSVLALGIHGRSSSMGLEWSHPLVRARLHNLYFSGGLDNKRFFSSNRNSTPTDPQSYSDYETDSLRLGLSGNRFDDLGSGGANSGTVQLLWGRLTAMQAHGQINTLDRSYHKLSYSLIRQQALTAAHSLLLSLQGQQATQVLDSSEKFYIGGASTVRAYPSSELGGERGHVLSVEWRWRLNAAWSLAAFVDRGQVVILPATSSDAKTSLTLIGHGLSASWQGPAGVTAKLTWAHRQGANPRPTQVGTDSDGTLKLNRIWLSTSVSF